MNEENIIKIKDLAPNRRRLNIKVRVLEIGEKKDIVSRRTGDMHRIVETLVGDDTGVVKLTLWDDKVNSLEAGKSYLIKNTNTTVYQGTLRLNAGKYSEIEELNEEIDEGSIDTSNNVSEKEIQYTRSYGRRNYGRSYR